MPQVVCQSNENNFIYHFTELFITAIYCNTYVALFFKDANLYLLTSELLDLSMFGDVKQ